MTLGRCSEQKTTEGKRLLIIIPIGNQRGRSGVIVILVGGQAIANPIVLILSDLFCITSHGFDLCLSACFLILKLELYLPEESFLVLVGVFWFD